MLQHKGTQLLETPRLILRKFTMDDTQAMYENWASDPEVTKYLTWPTHENAGISEMVLRDWCSHYPEPDFYQWAIVPKALGEPIGSISVVKIHEDAQWVELGYCIGRKWWRGGYTSEALKALVAFFFEEVGAGRIQALHDPRNPNSGAVMRKCGLISEGTLRQAGRNNQGICDETIYAILREEYHTCK